ncbi:MAG: protein translocase subunit SecF [Candidatus Planktophila sp.]|nr:protein translocase subunit SecF [Candidatus Planktophila sp.]MSO24477.1 protein translocase subunit SecF [Candidatus Planktophila sp.]PHX70090.1 MAG: protein translocase subunit SecF [Actinomycetota bacterium]
MAKISGLGGRLYSGETSFNIVENRKRWYSISALFLLASIAALTIQGLHLGLEFKGGASYTVTKPGLTLEQGREAASNFDIPGEAIVQKIGDDKIRIQTGALTPAQATAAENVLTSTFDVPAESIDTQIVGPSWGKEITKKAIYGLIAFLLAVMLFLAMAFEPKMALAAIVAVVHDVLITVGIYAVVGFDVTPATVIGFLTILGYSLYDTVVVFDKVRENTKSVTANSKQTYSQAANLAVNQTLVRSANTSIIALLPVGSILFVGAGLLGAGTLKDLSLALFIGLAVGTYSSVFIAPPFLASLREKEPAMQALAKRVAARGGAVAITEDKAPQTSVTRGPRNQPKRKGRK